MGVNSNEMFGKCNNLKVFIILSYLGNFAFLYGTVCKTSLSTYLKKYMTHLN